MPGGGWNGAPPPQTGFQRHHLIPIALLRRPQMAVLFDHLQAEGFALQQFARNGLILPACETAALRSGYALHRGPHHGYSEVVAARVEKVRAHFVLHAPADLRTARRTAVMRLRLLQDTTRRALTDRHGCGFWLNRRDPMRLFADRPYLDEAIDRLFGEQGLTTGSGHFRLSQPVRIERSRDAPRARDRVDGCLDFVRHEREARKVR